MCKEPGALSQIPNDTITNVGTRNDIGNRDGIGHESESKDPSQNNSEQGALSQIPNCNALGNDTVTNVGTRNDIGNI